MCENSVGPIPGSSVRFDIKRRDPAPRASPALGRVSRVSSECRPSVKTADKRGPRRRGRTAKDGASAAFALDALGLFLRSGPAAPFRRAPGWPAPAVDRDGARCRGHCRRNGGAAPGAQRLIAAQRPPAGQPRVPRRAALLGSSAHRRLAGPRAMSEPGLGSWVRDRSNPAPERLAAPQAEMLGTDPKRFSRMFQGLMLVRSGRVGLGMQPH